MLGPRARGFEFQPAKSTVIASVSEAIHRRAKKQDGLLRRVAPRNDGKVQVRDLAAGFARGLVCSFRPLQSEGAGNAGRSMRPQPCVRRKWEHTSVVTTVTPEIARHSPRNGFNGFFRALPGDRALLPPSSADHSTNLTPASGRQDHTTSPSATKALSSEAPLASTASRLTSVTIAKRPSRETG